MGAFAGWFQGIGRGENSSRLRLDPTRTLLLSDFEPAPDYLDALFVRPPNLLVLPGDPTRPLPGVTYARYRPSTNPISWEDGIDRAIAQGIRTAVFLIPFTGLPGRTFLRLAQLGIRRVIGWEAGRMRSGSPLYFGLLRLAQRGLGRLLPRGTHDISSMNVESCREVLAQALPAQPIRSSRLLRIVHFVTSLNSGGAERQACYAALGQAEAGYPVRIQSRLPLAGEDAHYLPLLEARGIPARHNGASWDSRFPELFRAAGFSDRLFTTMPAELAIAVQDLLGELLLNPVDVLHAYVDDCNIVGGIAACLAGTPRVVLSFRNGNPTHFPGLLRPWMRPWYEVLKTHPTVRFCSNSAAGARDYEDWLDLPRTSVPVVPNAFLPPCLPPTGERLQKRAELGIPADAPLIAGVFRLHPEKRPLYFLECIAGIRRAIPNLRVALAGIGPLESQVRETIEKLGLGDCILLLGQHREVPRLLAASDLLLLVSDWEGTPNVVVEAQYCGCVPVATAAGGTPEAVADGETGCLVGLHDLSGTVATVVDLLNDPVRRQRMASASPAFVRRRFSPEALLEANLALYRDSAQARAA